MRSPPHFGAPSSLGGLITRVKKYFVSWILVLPFVLLYVPRLEPKVPNLDFCQNIAGGLITCGDFAPTTPRNIETRAVIGHRGGETSRMGPTNWSHNCFS